MSRYTTAMNLHIHGYEEVARRFKRNNSKAARSIVVSPTGRVIYFHDGEPIPPALEPGHIGRFTHDCPAEVIEDALLHHMRT